MQLQSQCKQWIVGAGNCHMISQDKPVWKCAFYRSFLKMKNLFAVWEFSGKEFQTDGSARLEALFAILVLTGGWVSKSLSDERNTFVGNLSATIVLYWFENVQDGQFRVLWMSRLQFWTRSCSWWEASEVAWESAWCDRSFSMELQFTTRASEDWTRWSLEMLDFDIPNSTEVEYSSRELTKANAIVLSTSSESDDRMFFKVNRLVHTILPPPAPE